MKRILNISTLTFLIAIAFTSCVKDLTNTVYSGPDLIEIAPTIAKTITVPTTAGAVVRDSILVQLVGPQRTSGTNVIYSIDASSTALASECTLLTPSPVIISAGTSSTWIKFAFIKPAAQRTFIVNLTGGDNVTPSVNFKTFTYTLR